jgi:hypothetical protein
MADSGFDSVTKRVQAIQTSSKAFADGKNLEKKVGDTFERAQSSAQQSINGLKDKATKSATDSKSQLESMLNLSQVTNSNSTTKYLKKKFVKALKASKPKMEQIFLEEALNAIGCSQEQEYDNTVPVYIKVRSVDLFGMLKKSPTSKVGKILYEIKPISYGNIPFSMNRELHERIINENIFYSNVVGGPYKGFSGQDLFDIRYVEVNPITGDDSGWFEVILSNRANNSKKIIAFLRDYFKSINLLELKAIFGQLMEVLAGIMSMKDDVGLKQVEDASRFQLLLARILGVCFDSRREIDVQGTSKIGEIDLLDESFFDLTEFDLRNINNRVNNIFSRVLEFENCNNIQIPVNFDGTIEALNNLTFVEGEEELNNIINLTGEILVNDNTLRGLGINFDFLKELDFSFLLRLPLAIFYVLLSPKSLLPIMIMIKQLGQIEVDLIESLANFFKIFKKFIIETISRIAAIFVEEMFKILKRDCVNLIQSVVNDLEKEQADKRIIMVLKLIQVIIVLAKLISDFRRCKSIIDELLQLLQIALPSNTNLSPSLLFGSQFLSGTSPIRAFVGTIQEMQKKGLPTGDLPSGRPNLFLQSLLSQTKGMMNEQFENGKTQISIPALSMTPAGKTTPSTGFGKSF